ncbi:MAG: D-glycero-beta-D-manno-heptose-7-phosphate kinase [Deltaproteobacteria bacterium]|nr:D-glycero-beta-D-manno-heptose-7-phosphate kinase [Deltaproteobacteria bacterium]MBW1948651.1 D-glycero-beta-D-manno-heptose-7-phosphate kinase [Deltaproteobacteria bacterium]MBW2006813.1 D-glycero-beta-D-manno-heptose-7-phosphate kinase [Deltaproteobacteria bacterium]MBW2347308.1 D-glycero-beta-D-manno-heptose-7-phosphate kinase [Deltaproteobacteria bacterium]
MIFLHFLIPSFKGCGEAIPGFQDVHPMRHMKGNQETNYGETLKRHIDRFPDVGVLVIGDIILDKYIWGDVNRISPEAPVPVVEIRHETRMLGGAANVIRNMATLGARPILCGVVGDDRAGQEIKTKLQGMGLAADGVVTEPGRPTSVKTRVIAHNQQVVRFDKESTRRPGSETMERLLSFMEGRLSGIQAVVVSDYGKGCINGELMTRLRELIGRSRVIVGVDPKTGNFEHYRGVDVITPNHFEAGTYCGFPIVDEGSLLRAGRKMLETLDCRSVLITRGKDGMSLFERDGAVHHIPTVARKVFDVTGAGDTVIGTFCLGLASGLDLRSSAVISNYAAGIVVGEVGTSAVAARDLKRAVNGLTG